MDLELGLMFWGEMLLWHFEEHVICSEGLVRALANEMSAPSPPVHQPLFPTPGTSEAVTLPLRPHSCRVCVPTSDN